MPEINPSMITVGEGYISFRLTANVLNIRIFFTADIYTFRTLTMNEHGTLLNNTRAEIIGRQIIEDDDSNSILTGSIEGQDTVFSGWAVFRNNNLIYLDAVLRQEFNIIVQPDGSISNIKFTAEFIDRFKNDNEIILVAVFAQAMRLNLTVSDNAPTGTNDFDIFVNRADTAYDRGLGMEFEFGTHIRIVPRPDKVRAGEGLLPFYRFASYTSTESYEYDATTGELEIVMNRTHNLTINFVSEVFVGKITPPESARGTLVIEVDGVEQTGETFNFAIGSTIRISFTADQWYDLNTMSLSQTQGGRAINADSGTLTINVTTEWLATWVNNKNEFEVELNVETKISQLVPIGAGGIGIALLIIVIALLLTLKSIKKKRADYALAKERHAKGMARLNQNVVRDLLKESDSEGGAK
jgi:hypothetical protein